MSGEEFIVRRPCDLRTLHPLVRDLGCAILSTQDAIRALDQRDTSLQNQIDAIPVGPVGPTGPTGPIQSGPVGPTGPIGVPTGPIGNLGPSGVDGPLGPDPTALPSSDGPTGSDGPQGSTGSIGPPGASADIGPLTGSVQYNTAGFLDGDNPFLYLAPNLSVGSGGFTGTYQIGGDHMLSRLGTNSVLLTPRLLPGSQGDSSVGIGLGAAGAFIGPGGGQGANCVAIGNAAAGNIQADNAIALGTDAARIGQGLNGIAIGSAAANLSQGEDAIAVGRLASNSSQGPRSISLGIQTGQASDGCIGIGFGVGGNAQGNHGIAIGNLSCNVGQGVSGIAIGLNSAFRVLQGANCVAIGPNVIGGFGFGGEMQGAGSVAIGSAAGFTGQGVNCVEIGTAAGQNFAQGDGAVAIGRLAGGFSAPQQLDSVAIGRSANVLVGAIGSIALGTSAIANTGSEIALSAGFDNPTVPVITGSAAVSYPSFLTGLANASLRVQVGATHYYMPLFFP